MGESFASVSASIDSVLVDVNELLGALVERPADDSGSIDLHLSSFYRQFRGLRERHATQELSVAILALTKSGE